MKVKRIIVISLLNLLCLHTLWAQDMEKGLDLSFRLGLNIGFTTPVPLPKALDVTKYNPRINPNFGANLSYFFTERWGIGTGLTLEWKGMNVHTEVDKVHLTVDVPNIGTLTGDVTGKNKNACQCSLPCSACIRYFSYQSKMAGKRRYLYGRTAA